MKGIGCYIFGIRAGGGIRPYYVGKAAKSFGQEIFTPHKLNIYNTVLGGINKGNPVIILIEAITRKGKVSAKVISDVEKHIISLAYHANPELRNIQNLPPDQKWILPGIMSGGKGKISTAAKTLKNCVKA